MKYAGKAKRAGFRLLSFSLLATFVLWAIGALAAHVAGFSVLVITVALGALWVVFALFTCNFFRDPDARPQAGANIVVSPAHGKVDVIGVTTEPQFMGGECQRISIFLSVIDIHVQNAPVTGKIAFYKYATGQFLNALKAESAVHNENLLLGFEASEPRGQKVGVRIIAGVLARRIVPWAQQGDDVTRGERLSLVQFGSRADLYLPSNAKIKVRLGDHVVGGETVVAAFE